MLWRALLTRERVLVLLVAGAALRGADAWRHDEREHGRNSGNPGGTQHDSDATGARARSVRDAALKQPERALPSLAMPRRRARHILVLTDRDWTHPQAGGTGTVLYGLIASWLADGHRVTVIAGTYDGAAAVSRYHERLAVHRMGSRLTVFARAAWATLRGLGRDADVVLEVCNGIAFETPLWPWLRKPRAVLVFHVHQDHYIAELGTRGKVAAFLLERLPLTVFYRGTPVITISESSRAGLIDLGVPAEQLRVVALGLETGLLAPGKKSPQPSLIYLGRLKQYKRIEHVLDVAAAIPRATLHLAGEGGWRPELEAHATALGISDRVAFHGHVDERQKAELLRSSWLALTASSAEGWCLTVIEAAASGTPTAALRVGGLEEAIVDGETGLLADDAAELEQSVSRLLDDPERLRTMGDAALTRSRDFTWSATASATLETLDDAIAAGRPRLRDALAASESSSAAALAAATLGNNAIQLVFTVGSCQPVTVASSRWVSGRWPVFSTVISSGMW